MKGLLVCSLKHGGICHYTYSLAEALQDLGNDITVLTQSGTGYELDGIAHSHRLQQTLRVGAGRADRIMAPVINLKTLLRETRDTPFVHFQWPLGRRNDPLLWRALKRNGTRIVYTAHNVVPHEAGNRKEDHTSWLYGMADAIIVHGEHLKQQLVALAPQAERNIHVNSLGNYNFVADRYTRWNRSSARASFGWCDDEQVVLFFGLIRAYKGLDTLIEACRIVSQRNCSSLRLLIAGANLDHHWEQAGYERLIDESGLSCRTRCVIEHVAMADIGRYFHASDIVALPYRSGSQSAVLPLAYAFARPVIVTDVGSISEAIEPGVTGLIVRPEDPSALASALLELLGNPAMAAAIGARGRHYAETRLDWRPIAAETQRIYRSVIA